MQNVPILRPDLLQFSSSQLKILIPFLGPVLGSLFSIVLGVSPAKALRTMGWWVVVLSLSFSAVYSGLQLGSQSETLFNDMMRVDDYARLFNVFFSLCGIFTLIASEKYLETEQLKYAEYHLLILFSVIGMMWMTASSELITMFIGLEIMSLSVYTLVGFRRNDRRSNEASIKYFILGAAASAVLLYGSALLYGTTGTTKFNGILNAIKEQPELMNPLFVVATGLVIVGFLFKVAAVPFHMWMPDVYEGAPAPITGFMTTGVKAASFAIFLKVLISLGYGRALSDAFQSNLQSVMWIVAALTMIIGNVIALTQTNLKRMLAYSSIAHTGYLILGIIAGVGSPQGYSPVVLYLIAYAVSNIGAFTVLTMISKKADSGLNLHDLSGISKKSPTLSVAMAAFMFSMAGIPPTAGFLSKYLMFYAAVQSGEVLLTVLAVLCSAISVYYYLRVLVYMYMRDPVSGHESLERLDDKGSWFAVVVSFTIVLYAGIQPSWLIEVTKRAVTGLQ